MGALASKDAHEAYLEDLLAAQKVGSPAHELQKRLVLIPMTKLFMNRNPDPRRALPTSSAAAAKTATVSTTSTIATDARAMASEAGGATTTPANTSCSAATAATTAATATCGKRGQGRSQPGLAGGSAAPKVSLAAPVDLFGSPADFPLVRQLYSAYCEPAVQFFCRKDGWGASPAQMPERLYYPSIDSFYEATVAYYTSLVENVSLTGRPQSSAASVASMTNPTASTTNTSTSATHSSTAPVPIPCAVCFRYPTNRLATAEVPYDPSVYSHRTRGPAAKGSGRSSDDANSRGRTGGKWDGCCRAKGVGGHRELLAPMDSVVFGRKASLMAIGFVGLVPTRLLRPPSPSNHVAHQSHSISGTGNRSSWASSPLAGMTSRRVGGPVPFIKPPPDSSAANPRGSGGDHPDPRAPSGSAGRSRQGEPLSSTEEEYELIVFLSRSGGSFFMARALLMAIHLYVSQCKRSGYGLLALPPIRYSAMLTDLVLQSVLRELRNRVLRMCALSSRSTPVAAEAKHSHHHNRETATAATAPPLCREVYDRLVYYLRHRFHLTEGSIEGRLPSEQVGQLFQLVHAWWSLVEAPGGETVGEGGTSSPALPQVASSPREEAISHQQQQLLLSVPATLENVSTARAVCLSQSTPPTRYFFYGIVEDVPVDVCVQPPLLPPSAHTSTPAARSASSRQPRPRPLPSSGGSAILEGIRSQLTFAAMEETAAVCDQRRRMGLPAQALRDSAAIAADAREGSSIATGEGSKPSPTDHVSDEHAATATVTMHTSDSGTVGLTESGSGASWIYVYAVVGPAGCTKLLARRPYEQHALAAAHRGESGEVPATAITTPTVAAAYGATRASAAAIETQSTASEVVDVDLQEGTTRSEGAASESALLIINESDSEDKVWPEGTVLRQRVDLQTGDFLLPCWEVAMEPADGEYDDSTEEATGKKTAERAAQRLRRRRRRQQQQQRRERRAAAASSGNSGVSSHTSDSSESSPSKEVSCGEEDEDEGGGSNRSRRAQRRVCAADVVLSWLKDTYLCARAADRQDSHWRSYYPSDHFVRPTPPPPQPPTSQPASPHARTCSAASATASDAAVTGEQRRSPLTSSNLKALEGAHGERNGGEATTGTGLYVWEFEHHGRTYGIALKPNFARDGELVSPHAGTATSTTTATVTADVAAPAVPVAVSNNGSTSPGGKGTPPGAPLRYSGDDDSNSNSNSNATSHSATNRGARRAAIITRAPRGSTRPLRSGAGKPRSSVHARSRSGSGCRAHPVHHHNVSSDAFSTSESSLNNTSFGLGGSSSGGGGAVCGRPTTAGSSRDSRSQDTTSASRSSRSTISALQLQTPQQHLAWRRRSKLVAKQDVRRQVQDHQQQQHSKLQMPSPPGAEWVTGRRPGSALRWGSGGSQAHRTDSSSRSGSGSERADGVFGGRYLNSGSDPSTGGGGSAVVGNSGRSAMGERSDSSHPLPTPDTRVNTSSPSMLHSTSGSLLLRHAPPPPRPASSGAQQPFPRQPAHQQQQASDRSNTGGPAEPSPIWDMPSSLARNHHAGIGTPWSPEDASTTRRPCRPRGDAWVDTQGLNTTHSAAAASTRTNSTAPVRVRVGEHATAPTGSPKPHLEGPLYSFMQANSNSSSSSYNYANCGGSAQVVAVNTATTISAEYDLSGMTGRGMGAYGPIIGASQPPASVSVSCGPSQPQPQPQRQRQPSRADWDFEADRFFALTDGGSGSGGGGVSGSVGTITGPSVQNYAPHTTHAPNEGVHEMARTYPMHFPYAASLMSANDVLYGSTLTVDGDGSASVMGASPHGGGGSDQGGARSGMRGAPADPERTLRYGGQPYLSFSCASDFMPGGSVLPTTSTVGGTCRGSFTLAGQQQPHHQQPQRRQQEVSAQTTSPAPAITTPVAAAGQLYDDFYGGEVGPAHMAPNASPVRATRGGKSIETVTAAALGAAGGRRGAGPRPQSVLPSLESTVGNFYAGAATEATTRGCAPESAFLPRVKGDARCAGGDRPLRFAMDDTNNHDTIYNEAMTSHTGVSTVATSGTALQMGSPYSFDGFENIAAADAYMPSEEAVSVAEYRFDASSDMGTNTEDEEAEEKVVHGTGRRSREAWPMERAPQWLPMLSSSPSPPPQRRSSAPMVHSQPQQPQSQRLPQPQSPVASQHTPQLRRYQMDSSGRSTFRWDWRGGAS